MKTKKKVWGINDIHNFPKNPPYVMCNDLEITCNVSKKKLKSSPAQYTARECFWETKFAGRTRLRDVPLKVYRLFGMFVLVPRKQQKLETSLFRVLRSV